MAAASSSSAAAAPAAPAAIPLPVAAAIVAAAPAASRAAPGDIYQTYNPQGAMGDLFAPAYIAGYKPSEDAVAAWNAAHTMSRADVEATRMPAAWQAPQAVNPSARWQLAQVSLPTKVAREALDAFLQVRCFCDR